MKSIRTCVSILVALLSLSAGAESWLRPDTQEPRCLGKSEEKLAACLQSCDRKPEATASLCRRQCLESQEDAKKACDKKSPVEIRLPGT
jgi:hypothetical protein